MICVLFWWYDTYNEEYHGPYKEMALSRLEHDKKEMNYSFNLNYYQISWWEKLWKGKIFTKMLSFCCIVEKNDEKGPCRERKFTNICQENVDIKFHTNFF